MKTNVMLTPFVTFVKSGLFASRRHATYENLLAGRATS